MRRQRAALRLAVLLAVACGRTPPPDTEYLSVDPGADPAIVKVLETEFTVARVDDTTAVLRRVVNNNLNRAILVRVTAADGTVFFTRDRLKGEGDLADLDIRLPTETWMEFEVKKRLPRECRGNEDCFEEAASAEVLIPEDVHFYVRGGGCG